MNAQLPSVRQQHALLRIDSASQSFSGWTELHVAPPAAAAVAAGGATLGLHCYGLTVQSVQVNGIHVQFELQPPVREELPESVTAGTYDSPQRQATTVAEHSFYLYERQLQRERQPELSFRLPEPLPPAPAAAGWARSGSGGSGGKEARGRGREPLHIRVEWNGGGTSGSGAGLLFWQQYACTDNQVRRASAWLPCVDIPSASAQFSLDVTCRADQVAVGPGQLLRQSWADAQQQWRTFHYDVPLACAPCQLGVAVGPLQAEASSYLSKVVAAGGVPEPSSTPAPQQKQFTHFAPQQLPPELAVAAVLAAPPSLDDGSGSDGGSSSGRNGAGGGSKAGALPRTAHFFSLAFALFEEVLGAQCPLPAMHQVFLPPELLLQSEGTGQALAGLQLLSTAQLIQPRAIEQSIAARCAIARCLARQWFGVLLRAATPLDEWLVEGLSGWLEEQYVRRYMGRNELAYRRWRERQAIFLADNGEAPPLAARGVPSPSPWGPLYGTDRLDPSRLWATKATAVVAMLEKRAGEDLFRKHLCNVVAAGLAALEAEHAAAGGAAAATAAAGAGAAAAGISPLKPGAGGEGGAGLSSSTPVSATRLLDTMTFLNDLGRAGSFRKEMAPFAVRWIYGRGVPHITAAFIYHGRLSALELALKQTGSESAKRAADIATRSAVAEGSNAGIVKAVVREAEGDQYADHPVHLGGEAFVLAELKVTPVVEKKVPGRRGRKPRKVEGEAEEGAEEEAAAAAAPSTENPVRWVRLDPGGELLCDIRLLQPERMLAAQLLHSRDVVAQAEAVQRLSELRVTPDGVRQAVGLEALRKTLHDRTVFYRVRCDAALALAGLKDDQGQAAGLPVLLDCYRGAYFHPGTEAPRTVAIADPSEYYVAQAVVTAVSLCREPDGTTPVDAVLFLTPLMQDYASASGAPFSDYGLVAAMCASLGNLQFEGFGDTLLTLLEKFLDRDAVLVSPGNAVGCACLLAMSALCASSTFNEEEAERVALAARRVRNSTGLPVALRHAALAASLQLAAAQRGPAAALQLAVAAVTSSIGGTAAAGGSPPARLELPAASSPAFLLEEAAGIVTAANSEAASLAANAAAIMGEQAAGEEVGPVLGVSPPMPLLQQLAGLLSAGQDCRVRHLAFVVLQLLAVQPPTLYRPPATEAEDIAAFIATVGGAQGAAAGQAVSMGVTHRTGGGAQASHGTAAAAAAAAAPKIRLQLPTGRPGGTRSMGISGVSAPALSGEGPAMSDARMAGEGFEAGETVEQRQAGVPAAAQGQLFSPVRPTLEAAAPPPPQFAGFATNGGAPAMGGMQQQQQAPVPADIMAAFGAAVPGAPIPMAAPPAPGVPQVAPPALPQQQQQAAVSPTAPAAAAAPKVRIKVAPPADQQPPAGAQQTQQQAQQRHRSRTPSPAPGGAPLAAKKRKTPPAASGQPYQPAAEPPAAAQYAAPAPAAAWPAPGAFPPHAQQYPAAAAPAAAAPGAQAGQAAAPKGPPKIKFKVKLPMAPPRPQ